MRYAWFGRCGWQLVRPVAQSPSDTARVATAARRAPPAPTRRAVRPAETGFGMHVIYTAKIPWTLVSKSDRPGRVHRKLVHEGSVSPGVGYTADLVRYEGGHGTFSAPRHKHNF